MQHRLVVLMLLALAATAVARPKVVRYTDACDASAAAALSADLFVVANDEDNVLRFYRKGTGGRPVTTLRLDGFLGVDEESDLEAVARVGDRLYWITSHGRNKKGKLKPARHRFFATDVRGAELAPAGTPFRDLQAAMIADPKLAPLKLSAAAPLAPEAEGGFNIEALAARPDGSLWIGFRNPLPGKRAILVPLENPADVAQGRAPKFGSPVPLDLEGRGVRALERVGERYLLVAGPPADSGAFALYEWTGRPEDAPKKLAVDLGDLRPEAIVPFPDGSLWLVSDDGGVSVGGVDCKDLPDASAKSFRAAPIALPR